jgi:hypothetical protein
MLTLKELQRELEDLKKNKNSINLVEQPQSKNKTPLLTRASAPILFIITSLLSYGHKIPMVSKLINILSIWYGRTTWWKLLITLRKVFIVVNALIGIYTVLKISGFSSHNLLGGIYFMGYTYFEMFISTLSRLFKWLSSFFDYITPDVPKPKPTIHMPWPNIKDFNWATRPMNPNGIGEIVDFAKIQDFYPPRVTSVSSDWNLSSWLWYGGIAIVTMGALYLGYVLITSPEFIDSIAPSTKITPPTPPSDPSIPHTPPSDGTSFLSIIGHKISNIINPFKWFNTQAQINSQFNNFMERQYNPATHNNQLYPFTVDNPYLPWYKKLTLAMFGESKADEAIRLSHIDFAYRDYDVIRVGVHSPYVGTVGLGINSPSDWNNLLRLNSLPPTPTHSPTIPPIDLPDVAQWQSHSINRNVEQIATSSNVTVEALDNIYNRYNFLDSDETID